MLRFTLSLLAKKKLPPPPKRGRQAAPQRGRPKSVTSARSPSQVRRMTPKGVPRQPSVRKTAIKAAVTQVGRRSASSGRGGKAAPGRVDNLPVVETVEAAPSVVPSVEVAPTSTALAVGRKPQYSLATAVSTVIVPPAANAALEAMKQTLSPSVRSPSEGGVDLCGDGSGVEQGGDPPSQMEEFYTPKKGPLFATAVIAGTNAVKQTSQMIPFCHPARIHKCSFTFRRRVLGGLTRVSSLPHRVVLRKRATPASPLSRGRSECSVIYCFCTVATDDEPRSSVEMEALSGATMAALTMYDMLRTLPGAQEDGISVGEAFVLAKRGTRGDFTKLLVSELPTEELTGTETEVRRAALTSGLEDHRSDCNTMRGNDYEGLSDWEGSNTETREQKEADAGEAARREGDELDDGERSQIDSGRGTAEDGDDGVVRREHEAATTEENAAEAETGSVAMGEKERAAMEETATLEERSAWWKSTARERRLQQNLRPEGSFARPAPQTSAQRHQEVKSSVSKDAARKLGLKSKPQEFVYQKPKIIPVSRKSAKLPDKDGGIVVPKGQRVVVVEDEYYEEQPEESHLVDDNYEESNDEYESHNHDAGAFEDEVETASDVQHKKKWLRSRSGESIRAQAPPRAVTINSKKGGDDHHGAEDYADDGYAEDALNDEEIELGSRQNAKKSRVLQSVLTRRDYNRSDDDMYDYDSEPEASGQEESWDSVEKGWVGDEADDWSSGDARGEAGRVGKVHSYERKRHPLPLPKKKEIKLKKVIKPKHRVEKR